MTRARAQALGRQVRAELGVEPPLLAIQTSFSFLRGIVTPEEWGAALAGLCHAREVARADRRGANHPAQSVALTLALQVGAFQRATQVPPPSPVYVVEDDAEPVSTAWAALADLGDLAGLPACIDQWGRRVAVGATVPVRRSEQGPTELVFCLAPEHAGYRALCRLLSWRNEHEDAWSAWQTGFTQDAPSLDGLVVLVPSLEWAERFAWHGAETFGWQVDPSRPPAPELAPVFAPLLTALQPGQERRQRLQALIQDRSHVRQHIEMSRVDRHPVHLTDLPGLLQAMRDQPDAVARGRDLLRRCTYAPGAPLPNGHTPWQLPPAQVADPEAELRMQCQKGVFQRYGGKAPPTLAKRLAYELDVITKKGFSPYILAVWSLTRFRQTCGRGSAASSLVCYVLGITNVDPLKYNLVFERFLSEERFDPPDIDVDFAHDERDAVLQQTIKEFGRDHVALVATHQTLHRHGAMRMAGNALGKDRAPITAAQREVHLQRQFQLGNGPGSEWKAVAEATEDLVGTMTNYGVHCGGVIITTEPIREVVPIHPAAKELFGEHAPAIAWEKDGAEQLGLVKIDFLGNRSLGVVRDTLRDLRDDGFSIDEWRWQPDEDSLARRLVATGRTIGCFYIESPAMRLLNAKTGETDFDRLTLNSSIIRPAANVWINTYLDRLTEFRRTGQHRAEWYPHPALRALLSDSFGVLSYQEDLMLIARDLAGFSIKEQNRLRKALGRSDTPQRLVELRTAFVNGCRQRAVEPVVIEHVWSMIVSFAGYSFTKAHSASYVQVSFQAAWLKVHHTAHFMARVISNGGGFYSPAAYVEEARRWKVAIDPPCVVQGHWDTQRSSQRSLRLGFQLVRGLHRRTVDRIISERQRQPFLGMGDFWRRSRASAAEMRLLLDAGAFDGLLPGATPAQREWLVEQAIAHPHSGPADDPSQLEFEFTFEYRGDPPPPPDLPMISQRDLDHRAWKVLGVLPRAHPFAMWDLPLKRRWRCHHVHPDHRGRVITVLAWVITAKQVISQQLNDQRGAPLPTPNIRPMAFVTLEDEEGIAETVWFPDTYQRFGVFVDAGLPLLITGQVQVDHGVAILEVRNVAQVDT